MTYNIMLLQDIQNAVENTHVFHHAVNIKSIRLQDNGQFEFTRIDGTKINDMYFTNSGLGTANWMLAGNKLDKDKYDKKDFTYGEFSRLNREHNEDKSYIMLGYTISNRLLKLCELLDVTELWLHGVGHEIRGITRNYNDEITAKDILQAIIDNGLKHRLIDYRITETAQRFYLKANDNTFLVVNNGYTGHEKLHYSVLTRFDDKEKAYVFEKNKSANKHLGKLEMTFNDMVSVLDVVLKSNLESYFNTITNDQFISGLINCVDIETDDDKTDVVGILSGINNGTNMDWIETDTVIDLIAWSSYYANSNRKKVKFQKIMDKYLVYLSVTNLV